MFPHNNIVLICFKYGLLKKCTDSVTKYHNFKRNTFGIKYKWKCGILPKGNIVLMCFRDDMLKSFYSKCKDRQIIITSNFIFE